MLSELELFQFIHALSLHNRNEQFDKLVSEVSKSDTGQYQRLTAYWNRRHIYEGR